MSAPLLDIDHLSCERDDRLLFESLSFSCDAGSLTQIKGSNGAGKTSLLTILAGLLDPSGGDIRFTDISIYEDLSFYHQHLLYFTHRSAVKNELTARDNLKYLHCLQGGDVAVDFDQALAAMGLAGYEDSYCRHLSAGQKRRVSLARLLLSEAPVWLLDEPFTALDQKAVADLEHLLAQKAREGRCIVFTTHHQVALDNLACVELGKRHA